MRSVALILCAASLALAGCGTLATAVGVPAATQKTVHIAASQAFSACYDAVDFVLVGIVEPSVKAGELHGNNAANVAAGLRQVRALLDTSYAAYQAGTLTDPSQAISSALTALGNVKAVLNNAGVETPTGAGPAAYVVPLFSPTPSMVRTHMTRVLAELQQAT